MKTYTFGLLQASAYRALKGHTLKQLGPFDITTYEWAILGVLSDAPGGLRTTELARILGVKKPFITKAVAVLTKKQLVERTAGSAADKRSVTITLTRTGHTLVPKIEKHLRRETSFVFTGISKMKLLIYMQVLRHIIKKLDEHIDDAPVV